jgi:hypothetical protein
MPRNYDLSVTPANAQRRPENAQPDEWVRAFLTRAHIGQAATVWGEQPFITPTTFWYSPERHEIYFHSNLVGRVRANAEQHARVCFETSVYGDLLPSNIALEFTIQYESVMAYGLIRVVEELDDKRRILSGLIAKYFPTMTAGKEYRPITDAELKRTSVYAIAIESWSGKRNWPDEAEQSEEWPKLGQSTVNSEQ